MNILQYTYLFLAVTLCSCSNRKSCDGKKGITYGFDLPVTISQAKDTFTVGDTIWVDNSFSNQIVNSRNNKTYTVNNFDFDTKMAIKDLNSPRPSVSYSNPTIVTLHGKTAINSVGGNDSYQSIDLTQDFSDGRYKYKCGIVLERSGFFAIIFFTLEKHRKVDITECPREDMLLSYKTNNATNNNYEMVKNAQDHAFSGLTLEDYNKIGGFCFYVK